MIRAILTDIEGTTSSIAFVKEVLFPYAREHMASWLGAHWEEERVQAQVVEVVRIGGLRDGDLETVVAQLHDWIDTDQKITPLKALQGWIWEEGFRSAAYVAHLYEDTLPHLRAWRERGLPLYVYSSGSIYAQLLYFGHTESGDVTELFSGHFDTTSGSKKESSSYGRIADAMGFPAQEILFLSDVVAELDAAREAGMETVWLVRDGPLPESEAHPVARDFTSVSL